MANYGPNDIYANIPDVDSRGIPGQIGKFLRWNPDPVGNDAQNLSQINPALQSVIAAARAANPNLNFVIGNGLRSAANQDLAKSWGWSRVGSRDGGDALVHMNGRAVDLWGLDANGRVQFDPGQQRQIAQAIQAAAAQQGVPINWGGNFRTFKDAPHFELAGQGTAESAGAPESHAAIATPQPQGATLNTTAPNDVIEALSHNIAQIESGGRRNPYGILGPNVRATADHPAGNAIGKYQVMSYNVGPWTQQALGRAMTPEEFQASPEAQEAVFRDQMSRTLKTYSPADAASIWFTGKPFSQAGASARDVLGTTNANYVTRATAGIQNANVGPTSDGGVTLTSNLVTGNAPLPYGAPARPYTPTPGAPDTSLPYGHPARPYTPTPGQQVAATPTPDQPAPDQPKTAGDLIKQLNTPQQGQQQSTLQQIGSALSGQGQQFPNVEPMKLPQGAPPSDQNERMMAGAQLMQQYMANATKPLSWTSAPPGSRAGYQPGATPGTTLTSNPWGPYSPFNSFYGA